jgi:small-conductance mechanosensitive channel
MDLGGPLERLLQNAVEFVPRLIAALVVFAASLILSGLVARWVRRVAGKRIADPEPCLLLSRLARWAVIIAGTLLSLDLVNFDVTGFVAGLGIAGLTVGFALQDIARNFVAGVLLLVRQPISIGDAVEVQGYTGTVLTINTRDTVIKTWDGETVILPNIEVFGSAIINYSELPYRRRTVRIGLGYGQDVQQATHTLLEAIRDVAGVAADPPVTVHAEELGDSALTLAVRFWLNQQTHSLLDVHSRVVCAIAEATEREGIELPYPIQTVHLEGDLEGLQP